MEMFKKVSVSSMFIFCVVLSYNECVGEAQCSCNVEHAFARACEVRLRKDAGWACGRLRAAEDGERYASFRGLPYAKPPVGDRRFKELDPPEPWGHLLDATEDGPVCPQKDLIYSRIPLQLKGMSEDCMYLNLHVPHYALLSTSSERSRTNLGLPILVFVHGGGFQAGSGLSDLHGPEYFMTKPVIVITFNYRIGVFGFLSLNTRKIPGNQALRDIVTLLHWVQRNAWSFGGNPRNVTLMGHSTGATCAHLVSLSSASKGLIHRVILMSGTGVPNFFTASPKQAKSVADKILEVLGINSRDPDEMYNRLVTEPIINIMDAYLQLSSEPMLLRLTPVVESEFSNVTRILDDEPLTLIAKGRGTEYPLMVGFTTNEFNFFKWALLGSDLVNDADADATKLLPARLRFNLPRATQIQLAKQLKQNYIIGKPSLDRIMNCYSDIFFVYPAMKVAQWRAAMGGSPVYLYQFSYESLRSVIKESIWANYRGPGHVEDLTYVFRVNTMLKDYNSYPPKNKDDFMKQWMMKAFANFIQCSNPTCTRDETDWPPLSEGATQYQDFAEPMKYQMRNLTVKQNKMIEFIDSIDDECRHLENQIHLLKRLKVHRV